MNVFLKKKLILVADAIGIGHWVVSTIVVILGQVTNLFADYGAEYPGLDFIYKFIDRPIYGLIQGIEAEYRSDLVVTMIIGQIVIVASSVIYAFIAYLALRLLFLLSE